jgi:hypothetical protein
MRRPFNELLKAMEQRRRQIEGGEGLNIDAPGLTYQARRRPTSCPDEEALCGWLDGKLRGKNLRRWVEVWGHVYLRRCQHCWGEIKQLTVTVRPAGQRASSDRLQWAWQGLTLPRLSSSWAVAKAKVRSPHLAWTGGALVVLISLSLWSIRTPATFEMVERTWERGMTGDLRTLPWLEMRNPSHAMHHSTSIWGD